MCGIWVYIPKKHSANNYIDNFNSIQHRGPDKSVLIHNENSNIFIGFHRLSIIDVANGFQPFIYETRDFITYLVCNGEIYNYKELYQSLNVTPKTNSDCEVILHLFNAFGEHFIDKLNGEFAFCICKCSKTYPYKVNIYIGRDRFGIRPLFMAITSSEFFFSSELKGIPFINNAFYRYLPTQIHPRKLLTIKIQSDQWLIDSYIYYNLKQISTSIYDKNIAHKLIREQFIKSVESRLMSERPLGCLLSGGLDSSLVSSITSKWCKLHNTKLHTFSIGMENSTDEKYAKLVSQHINSIHTHICLSTDDFLNAIENVIKAIETYDITTIRASVGQWLLSKYISENTDIKVLLIGDGSDELCGGYMYFHNAPNPTEFHNECVNLLENIHFYDVLRADRGIANHGLEARVPFLDHDFVNLYLSIDPNLRMPNGLEKRLLRESFADTDLLPYEVLFRRKEAFSDGISQVTNSWYSIIQNYVSSMFSDDDLNSMSSKYNAPKTKEALYYRKIYDKYYGDIDKIIPTFWLPKWNGNINEPSARVLTSYTT